MAGSYRHINASDGTFRFELIDDLGDAREALEDCHALIGRLLRSVKALLPYALSAAYPLPDGKTREELFERCNEAGRVILEVTGEQWDAAREGRAT